VEGSTHEGGVDSEVVDSASSLFGCMVETCLALTSLRPNCLSQYGQAYGVPPRSAQSVRSSNVVRYSVFASLTGFLVTPDMSRGTICIFAT